MTNKPNPTESDGESTEELIKWFTERAFYDGVSNTYYPIVVDRLQTLTDQVTAIKAIAEKPCDDGFELCSVSREILKELDKS